MSQKLEEKIVIIINHIHHIVWAGNEENYSIVFNYVLTVQKGAHTEEG